MHDRMKAVALAGAALGLMAAGRPPQLTWSNPSDNPVIVGLIAGRDDMSFQEFFARCDAASRTVELSRLGLSHAPRNRVFQIVVNGQRFDVKGKADEDSENGGFSLSGTTYYGATVLTALASATSVQVIVDGVARPLPVAGLRTAWASFRRHCGMA